MNEEQSILAFRVHFNEFVNSIIDRVGNLSNPYNICGYPRLSAVVEPEIFNPLKIINPDIDRFSILCSKMNYGIDDSAVPEMLTLLRREVIRLRELNVGRPFLDFRDDAASLYLTVLHKNKIENYIAENFLLEHKIFRSDLEKNVLNIYLVISIGNIRNVSIRIVVRSLYLGAISWQITIPGELPMYLFSEDLTGSYFFRNIDLRMPRLLMDFAFNDNGAVDMKRPLSLLKFAIEDLSADLSQP